MSHSPDKLAFDAFLCHSSKDARAVRRIHNRLEHYSLFLKKDDKKKNLRIFHYVADAPLNPSLEKALFNRITEIKHLILVSSPAAAKSNYVDFEIQSYLKVYGKGANIHVAWVAGDISQSFPPSFKEAFPNPVFADLRPATCNTLTWVLWKRRLFNKRTLPLLASLFEVDLDVLIRRDRRRRLLKRLAVGLVLAVITGVFAILYSLTPSHAWTEFLPSENRAVSRALVMKNGNGEEVIRSLSRWSHHFISDVPDNPAGMINEFDVSGKRIGEFRYWLDAGGEGEIYPTGDTTKWGSLTMEARRAEIDLIQEMDNPGLLYNYSKGDRCEIEEGFDEEYSVVGDSVLKNYGKIIASINLKNFEADAVQKAIHFGYDSTTVLWKPVFYQSVPAMFSFTYMYGDSSCTLSQVSFDKAETWKNVSVIPELDAGDIVAFSEAGNDGKTFYLAFTAVRENPIPNALFRTTDAGLTWKEILLPQEVAELNGWLMEDMGTSAANKDQVAISVTETRSGRPQRMILFSNDAGKNWRTVHEGMPLSNSLRLGGIDSKGHIVGVFDGRLYVWRALQFEERSRLILSPIRKEENF